MEVKWELVWDKLPKVYAIKRSQTYPINLVVWRHSVGKSDDKIGQNAHTFKPSNGKQPWDCFLAMF